MAVKSDWLIGSIGENRIDICLPRVVAIRTASEGATARQSDWAVLLLGGHELIVTDEIAAEIRAWLKGIHDRRVQVGEVDE